MKLVSFYSKGLLMYTFPLPSHLINHASRMDTGFFADYSFGSETYAITFIYVVREGDSSNALDTWDAPANNELSVRGLTPWCSGEMHRESGAIGRQSMQQTAPIYVLPSSGIGY